MTGPLEILQKTFGHSSFRPPQAEVIAALQRNRHVLVMMPTGMGKSLCYQIPALLHNTLTLVISPLIALMRDQVAALVSKGVDAAFINSSLSGSERDLRLGQLKEGRFRLLYVTPERFRKKAFLAAIDQRGVGLLAIDEAHCISQWGHDFRPDYSRIAEFRHRLGTPITIALTATATPQVQADIIEQLGLKSTEVDIFHHGISRDNLHLAVTNVHGISGKLKVIQQRLRHRPGNGIIYFSLIKSLETFSQALNQKHIPHLVYHGGLTAQQRKMNQDLFMAGDNRLILATNAFGMGIDKADIRSIIHAEVPGSLESYYQEIGRAGRDGHNSHCLLLYDQDDLLIQMNFIKWNNPEADLYSRLWQTLTDQPEEVNGLGLEWLKEHLLYRQKHDFRLETALAMLDRYHVTEGSLSRRDLRVVSPLPEQFSDEQIAAKILREQENLMHMVSYSKTRGCRKAFIHHYFGMNHGESCQGCDNCQPAMGVLP